MNIDYKTVLAVGGVVLVFAYLARRQALQAASTVASAVNPVSDQNVFYKSANALTQSITGGDSYVTDIFGANSYNPNTPAGQ